MSKRRNVHTGRVAKRLQARKNSFASRGSDKIANMMREPGSQNRKK